MRTYEAMFLMDPTLATDWPVAEAEINRILDRAEAKLLGINNWGERKLAYPMGRWKRGLYALSFFEAAPESIISLERDVQLSEKAIRVLVLRKDKMTPEAVEKALAAEPPSKTPARGDEWNSRPGPRAAGRERVEKKDAAVAVEEKTDTKTDAAPNEADNKESLEKPYAEDADSAGETDTTEA